MVNLPFALDPGGVLEREPRAVLDEGAVFVAACADHDPRAVPMLTVAWLDEPPGVTLAEVVEEDAARLLSEPGSLVIDRQPASVGGIDGVRTFILHRGPGGMPTASEQWRLLAADRRWTVTAMTALGDQPAWGPRLADVAATFRVA